MSSLADCLSAQKNGKALRQAFESELTWFSFITVLYIVLSFWVVLCLMF